MFAQQKLNNLSACRRLLVLEADLHRNVIASETKSLRDRLACLPIGRERFATNSPLFLAGGVVAGFLALRHWRKCARWMPTVLQAWRWAKSLRGG